MAMSKDYEVVVDGYPNNSARKEFLVKNKLLLSKLPNCALGSIAYTPDLGYIGIFDGNEWVEVKTRKIIIDNQTSDSQDNP